MSTAISSVSESNSGSNTSPDEGGVRSWIVKITGALLVVPALLNAGYDVYATIAKLPKTESEKINSHLFRKYFNKPPVVMLPLPIKSTFGTVEVKFQIYEEGEVYVEYGKFSQWFPFPNDVQLKHSFIDLLPSAFAQNRPELSSTSAQVVKQSDSLQGSVLVRDRLYSDGLVLRSKIDTRTGKIEGIERLSGGAKFGGDSSDLMKIHKIEPIILKKSVPGG